MAQTNKYSLTFERHKSKCVVVYYNGQFKRLEYKSGGMPDNLWLNLTQAIPFMEHHITDIVTKWNGRIQLTKIESKPLSQYSQFLDEYFMFFELNFKFKPKINGAEGKALKEIIKYLSEITSTQEEALTVWQQLLAGWNQLEDFYQQQNQLKQINSNLTTILIQLKNGNTKTGNKNSQRMQTANSIVDELFDK